jgi:IPT/TIG domain
VFRSSSFGRFLCAAVFSLCAVLLYSCGGGSAGNSGGGGTTGGSFSISVSPSQVSLNQASISSTQVNVSVVANAGFSGLVTVSVQGLPEGVTINNASFPMNVEAGDAIQITFTAAATAALGSSNIEFIGNAGGAQSIGNLSLQVTLAQVSSTPPLRTSFANTDASPLSLGSSIAATKLLVYDSVRQQIFASNTSLNEVDVFSTVTRQQLAAIPVPYPYGIDITADGSAVYVGTFSDFLYVIDPQKLAVVNRISFAVTPSNGSWANSPQAVATLSDGTLALLMDFGDQFGLADGTSLIIWNPQTNSTTTLIASPGGGLGPLARSGDHSKIAFTFQGSIVPVNLYDVATAKMSTATYTGGGGIPYALALNADGSEVAVGGGLTLQTFDGQMNPQQSVNIESCFGLLFSPDGSKIYHSVSGVRESVFDAKSLELIGVILDVSLEGSVPGDIDATGIIYGLADHGVSFIDASFPVLTSDIIGGMDFATPQAGLLNTATPTSFGVGGTVAVPSVLFGASPAPRVSAVPFQQGETVSATAPSSPTPGPVNVFVQWPDGLARLQAEDFSYGPWARYIFETGGPPQGGAPIGLAGYGYGWSLGSPQIFVGPNAATISLMTPVSNYIEPYPYQQLEVTLMTSPPGSPGPADVKIVSPTGTVTAPGAFHFMNQVTSVPLSPNNLMQGVWDESRNQIYFTAGSQIQVYSTVSHQFTTPIAIPNSTAATQLAGIAITPDLSKLLVSDFGDSAVLVIDLNNISSVTSVSTVLPSDAQFNATSNPVTLAAANNGKILVAVPNRNITSPGPNTIREIDLNALTLTPRSELQVDASAVIQPALGGSELLFFDEGEISLYSAATDSFSGQKSLNLGGSRDSAISADGNRIAVEDALADGLMESLGFIGYIDLFVLDANLQFGEKWHPTGSLLYIPIDHGFDIIDGNTGKLRERISLPDVINSATPASYGESIDTLLVDSTGQNVVMITATGVTYVQLDSVPLGIGSATPSFGGAGTVFTLRGSGFTAGTTVSLNGASASVTFVDADTLTVTAPQNSAGAARITLTNSGGETYSLDAGFNYGSSPALQRVRLATGRAATPGGLGPLSRRPAAQRGSGRPAFYRDKP